MRFALALLFLLSTECLAAPSHCENLALFSCEPGTHADATGKVISSEDISKRANEYATKTRPALQESFAGLLDNPEDQQFRDLAEMAFDFDKDPDCTASASNDGRACREKTLNALVLLAQKESLGTAIPSPLLKGELAELDQLMNNPAYLKVRNEYLAKSSQDFADPVAEKKIAEKVFPQVQAILIERLNQMDMSEKNKKIMIDKISAIRFAGTDCTKIDFGPGAISAVFTPNAFVEPKKKSIKYCIGLLQQADSEFQMAMVLAHELSHMIDPCTITYSQEGPTFAYVLNPEHSYEDQFPIKKVLTCLQGPSSMGAPRFVPKKPTDPPFCIDSQLVESFCDWMGVEVLSKYIPKNHSLNSDQYRQGYANVQRNICWAHKHNGGPGSSHPDVIKRINNLLMVQPTVRTQMKCPPLKNKDAYCDPDGSTAKVRSSRPNKSKSPGTAGSR